MVIVGAVPGAAISTAPMSVPSVALSFAGRSIGLLTPRWSHVTPNWFPASSAALPALRDIVGVGPPLSCNAFSPGSRGAMIEPFRSLAAQPVLSLVLPTRLYPELLTVPQTSWPKAEPAVSPAPPVALFQAITLFCTLKVRAAIAKTPPPTPSPPPHAAMLPPPVTPLLLTVQLDNTQLPFVTQRPPPPATPPKSYTPPSH